LKENLGALDVKLSQEDIEEVRRVASDADASQGTRYPENMMHVLFANTPELKQ
jgi:diketogulonate reductase-like aldo/keto reductase